MMRTPPAPARWSGVTGEPSDIERHDIVVVGGGAGGLELAARLGRRLGRDEGRRRVALVDPTLSHLWKPSLHEVAAGSLDAHQEAVSYLKLARRNHFRFVLGELDGLDAAAREITLAAARDDTGAVAAPARRLAYERLVLAFGAGANFFDTPGAEVHARTLEDTADAEAFHRRLTTALMQAAYSRDEALRIAIVGAGATGVELAVELLDGHAELTEHLQPERAFRLEVTLIEALPRILNGLPESVADEAMRTLQTRGVRVMTGAPVDKVTPKGVHTSDGRVAADLIVWTAGVKPRALNARLGLKTGKSGRIIVDDHLRASAPDIFAIGDCAEAAGPGGKPLPPLAQVAAQQARHLARALIADADVGPFVYRDRGALVSLGRDDGAGAVKGAADAPALTLSGLPARWAYAALHLDHHRAILGTPRTALLAVSRLLRHGASGRLKLH